MADNNSNISELLNKLKESVRMYDEEQEKNRRNEHSSVGRGADGINDINDALSAVLSYDDTETEEAVTETVRLSADVISDTPCQTDEVNNAEMENNAVKENDVNEENSIVDKTEADDEAETDDKTEADVETDIFTYVNPDDTDAGSDLTDSTPADSYNPTSDKETDVVDDEFDFASMFAALAESNASDTPDEDADNAIDSLLDEVDKLESGEISEVSSDECPGVVADETEEFSQGVHSVNKDNTTDNTDVKKQSEPYDNECTESAEILQEELPDDAVYGSSGKPVEFSLDEHSDDKNGDKIGKPDDVSHAIQSSEQSGSGLSEQEDTAEAETDGFHDFTAENLFADTEAPDENTLFADESPDDTKVSGTAWINEDAASEKKENLRPYSSGKDKLYEKIINELDDSDGRSYDDDALLPEINRFRARIDVSEMSFRRRGSLDNGQSQEVKNSSASGKNVRIDTDATERSAESLSDIKISPPVDWEEERDKKCGMHRTDDKPEIDTISIGSERKYIVQDVDGRTSDEEYKSNSQNLDILHEYAKKQKILSFRLVFTVIVTILMFALENIEFFGINPAMISSGNVGKTIMLLDVLMLILCSVVSVFEITGRVSEPAHGRLLPVHFASFGAVLTVISEAIILLFYNSGAKPYGSVGGFYIILLLISEVSELRSSLFSFETVSSSGDKLVCEIDGSTEREKEAVGFDNVVRVKKTGFVRNFFENQNLRLPGDRTDFVLLITVSVLSLAASIIANYFGGSMNAACVMSTFVLVLSLALPSFAIIGRAYTLYCISRRANEAGSAIIGETAELEYSKTKAMLFEDVEAFPSSLTKVVKVKLIPDTDLNEVLYDLASMFKLVGGPLEAIFGVASAELGMSDSMNINSVESGGICANVDGRTVHAGTKEYLSYMGISVPEDAEDSRRVSAAPISILYVGRDGKYLGKFYIQYSFDRNFARRVAELNRNGVRCAIRTFDPGINDEILKRTTKLYGYGLTVIKKNEDEIMDFGELRMKSSLVTKYTSAQLINVIIMCKKGRRISRFCRILKFVLPVLSFVLVGICARFSILNSLYSVYALVYQSFFTLLYIMMAKMYLK